MDPLSISVSALAIIGAIATTIKATKSIYHAPEQIDSLLNDLSEAEIMIRDIQSSLGHDFNVTQTALQSSFNDTLKISENILLELKVILEMELKTYGAFPSGKRIAWIRVKRKTKALRKKLAEIHREVPQRFCQLENHRIRIELSNLNSAQEYLMTGIERLENHAALTNQQLARIDGTADPKNPVLQSSPTHLPNNIAQKSASVTVLGTQVVPPKMTFPITNENILLEKPSAGSAHFSPISIATGYQSLALNASFRNAGSCRMTCGCKCHQEQKVSRSLSLDALVGQLFIGYKALPGRFTSCTNSLCARRGTPTVKITYVFPQWWVRDRMMILRAKYQLSQGPEVALDFPRIVPPDAQVFSETSIGGSLEALRELFQQGLASPTDICSDDMATPLRSAINSKCWSIVQFLVHHGPGLERLTELDSQILIRVWVLILTQSIPIHIATWLADLFPYPGNEYFGFSRLHEAVLGIGRPVDQEIVRLSSVPETINQVDSGNSTPLWWAASRGDIVAGSLLLRHGADPNIANKHGCTPILAAIKFGKSKCVHLLLQHGADAHRRDNCQHGVFFELAVAPPSVHINETAEALYLQNADINSLDKIGVSAILAAIATNNITCVLWLLKHYVDYRVCHQATILQFLGHFGTLDTVRVLRDAQLTSMDVHATVGVENKTALMFLRDPTRPIPASQEVIDEFTLLLNEIEARTNLTDPSRAYSSNQHDVGPSLEEVENGLVTTAFPPTTLDSGEEPENEVFHENLERQDYEAVSSEEDMG